MFNITNLKTNICYADNLNKYNNISNTITEYNSLIENYNIVNIINICNNIFSICMIINIFKPKLLYSFSLYLVNFKNYYSYDDGTAEYAAGLNQKNSELLVKHHTFKKDTLTHLEFFFPKNIFSNYSSQIELVGYKNLDDGNQKFISQDVDINFNGSFNIFELKNPVIIEDSFFIGFRQKEDLFLPVGLDKHTNTSNKIFYKTDNQWYKNEIIDGSLMIRAVFGKSDFILTNTKEIKVTKEIIIYPNPGNGIYKLLTKKTELKIKNN